MSKIPLSKLYDLDEWEDLEADEIEVKKQPLNKFRDGHEVSKKREHPVNRVDKRNILPSI